jgi:hypothetical protein
MTGAAHEVTELLNQWAGWNQAAGEKLLPLVYAHPRQSQVVELRFSVGWCVEETAETLKVSPETVMPDWRAAKAWLYRELEGTGADEHRNDT